MSKINKFLLLSDGHKKKNLSLPFKYTFANLRAHLHTHTDTGRCLALGKMAAVDAAAAPVYQRWRPMNRAEESATYFTCVQTVRKKQPEREAA